MFDTCVCSTPLSSCPQTADKARDAKLGTQLNKIEKLLQEKGHDHAGAFAKPPRDAPTPGRSRGGRLETGEDPSLRAGGGKKQRI